VAVGVPGLGVERRRVWPRALLGMTRMAVNTALVMSFKTFLLYTN
jgi:hypothetical protein